MSHFRPFVVGGCKGGWLKRPFLDELAAFPKLFDIRDDAVLLAPALETPEARTAAVDEVLRSLAERGVIEAEADGGLALDLVKAFLPASLCGD